MRAVLGQQITVAAAIKLAGRLTNMYGRPLNPTLACCGLSATSKVSVLRRQHYSNARSSGVPGAQHLWASHVGRINRASPAMVTSFTPNARPSHARCDGCITEEAPAFLARSSVQKKSPA